MSETSKRHRDQAARCLRDRRRTKNEGLRRMLSDAAASYKKLASDEEARQSEKPRSKRKPTKSN
jgi:hypothetical protein